MILLIIFVIILIDYLILSKKTIPLYFHSNCTNGHNIYNGTWNENIIHKGYQNLSMKFHSNYEDYCNIKDFLIYSIDKTLLPDDINDNILAETKWRLKEIKYKFWLLLGTSVDHRLVAKKRVTSSRYDVCQLFGNEHQELKKYILLNNYTHHVYMVYCTIPIYKITIGYIFTGPISSDNNTFSSSKNHTFTTKLDTYLAINKVLTHHGMIPDIITLSGIEWDLFLFKHLLNTSYYKEVVYKNINIIRNIWPKSLLGLRTFYDSIDKYGRIYNNITYYEYEQYNNVFINITNESIRSSLNNNNSSNYATTNTTTTTNNNHSDDYYLQQYQQHLYYQEDSNKNHPRNEILLMDMRQIIRYNGSYTSGWTEDGLHPSGWVILQYMNIALHQINDLFIKLKLNQSD